MSTQTRALSAERITMRRGGRDVVRAVTISLEMGKCLGLFGPSGAGKSTLLAGLCGDQSIASGRVLLGERDVTRLPLYRRARLGLGYLPQTPNVLTDLTVAANLSVFAKATGADAAHLRQLVETLELDPHRATRARDLSGGERRRLELLRCLLGRPSVLLCDEPMAAIDPARRAGVRQVLRGVLADGGTILLADHHFEEVLELCDTAHLMIDGELKEASQPADFIARADVQRHYLGIVKARSSPE